MIEFPRFAPSLCVCLIALVSIASSQRLAIIEPEKSDSVAGLAAEISERVADSVRVIDASLAESAFRSVSVEDVFNLSADRSKQIGRVIGSDYFLFVRSRIQRRSALARNDYYEAYAVLYLISSRSGRLVFWRLKNAEAATPEAAAEALLKSVPTVAAEIVNAFKSVRLEPENNIEQVPPEDSPAAKNLKPPIPFRRIKPDYTRLAYLYDVRATVDAEVDIDTEGNVIRVAVVRWAGYGLDESVADAIRKMNWRPATRNGKTLPMRVLLRYNFKKIEE